MGDRRLIEVEQEGRRRVLYGSSQGDKELFVEGIHGIAFAGTHIKLNLYTIVPFIGEEDAEHREVVVRLVLPTTALPPIAQFLTDRVNELIQAGVLEMAGDQAHGRRGSSETDQGPSEASP